MPLAATTASILVVPILLKRFKATSVVLAGFSMAALTTFLGLILPVACIAVVLLSVLGIVQGATFASVTELNQTSMDQSFCYGLMAQTGNLGNLIGTPLLLGVLELSDVDALLLTCTAIYVIGCLALGLLLPNIATEDRRIGS
ncbi:hypothetical protein QTO30_00200 [Yoonia sp. GPGPB17]|uniref:hypothetical protein n=1 Tax=Yoonia sp. GPGPB17 TaxID=3026147 RepID=UPI0030BD6C13